jgi:hypothetical protein
LGAVRTSVTINTLELGFIVLQNLSNESQKLPRYAGLERTKNPERWHGSLVNQLTHLPNGFLQVLECMGMLGSTQV